jgi:LuxR family transcriptional regulator, maltose regulon positive regulatory protein
MRLHLAEGRVPEADTDADRLERLAADHPPPQLCAVSQIHHQARLGRALLALAENRASDAVSILMELHALAEQASDHYSALEVAVLLSVGRFEAGDLDTLPVAALLRTGAANGFYQTMLDQGPEIGALLLEFRRASSASGQHGDLVPYVDRLIEGWRARYAPETAPAAPRDGIAASLSPRERSILQLIGAGGSNKEIARTLGIAPETVKSHIKNIFVKLSVERRAQAVSRAQSLGLIRTI